MIPNTDFEGPQLLDVEYLRNGTRQNDNVE